MKNIFEEIALFHVFCPPHDHTLQMRIKTCFLILLWFMDSANTALREQIGQFWRTGSVQIVQSMDANLDLDAGGWFSLISSCHEIILCLPWRAWSLLGRGGRETKTSKIISIEAELFPLCKIIKEIKIAYAQCQKVLLGFKSERSSCKMV